MEGGGERMTRYAVQQAQALPRYRPICDRSCRMLVSDAQGRDMMKDESESESDSSRMRSRAACAIQHDSASTQIG